ncbi:uncharacterized protein METZ01_LOCUS255381, partial [marine metagenome]
KSSGNNQLPDKINTEEIDKAYTAKRKDSKGGWSTVSSTTGTGTRYISGNMSLEDADKIFKDARDAQNMTAEQRMELLWNQ